MKIQKLWMRGNPKKLFNLKLIGLLYVTFHAHALCIQQMIRSTEGLGKDVIKREHHFLVSIHRVEVDAERHHEIVYGTLDVPMGSLKTTNDTGSLPTLEHLESGFGLRPTALNPHPTNLSFLSRFIEVLETCLECHATK